MFRHLVFAGILTVLAFLPAASAGIPVEGPSLEQSHCTANAVSNPMGCANALLQAQSCKFWLIGAPPSFIIVPDPLQFLECVQDSHL